MATTAAANLPCPGPCPTLPYPVPGVGVGVGVPCPLGNRAKAHRAGPACRRWGRPQVGNYEGRWHLKTCPGGVVRPPQGGARVEIPAPGKDPRVLVPRVCERPCARGPRPARAASRGELRQMCNPFWGRGRVRGWDGMGWIPVWGNDLVGDFHISVWVGRCLWWTAGGRLARSPGQVRSAPDSVLLACC